MPRHPTLLILSTAEASMLLRSHAAPTLGAVISICGAREAWLEQESPLHLKLAFDDASDLDESTIRGKQRILQLQRRAKQDNAPIPVPPTSENISAVVNFARRIDGLTQPVLVHCAAGISRSPAVAMVCLAVWGEAAAQCLREVQVIRPACQPHRGILRHADQLLMLDGSLANLIQE
jgi:predicted protein tyrosine phosphatase